MKVKGKIISTWVTILIDIGSTHNFLDPIVVKRATLVLVKPEIVNVRIANGDLLPREGKSKGMKVKIQEVVFTLDIHVLILVGCDKVFRDSMASRT